MEEKESPSRKMRAALPLLALAAPAAGRALPVGSRPVDRIVGRWTAPPTKVPSDSVVDGPLLGNGRFGAVVSSDVGLPDTSAPSRGEVRWYVGMNDFYAAPTNGFSSWSACPPNPAPTPCPRPHSLP